MRNKTKGLIYYLNGEFVSEDEAKVSITDLGFVRGFGVFDFLKTYKGKPFKLREHLLRFKRSAEEITLKLPWTIAELEKLVLETLAKNHLKQANIKIIATGGIASDQITPSKKPTLAILIYPTTIYPPAFYEKGIKVITVPIMRAFPNAKSINYIPAIIALNQAKKQNAAEAIYKDDKNNLYEGTLTNFFVFINNVLVTPKDGVLSGITREVIINLAKKEFKIKLRPINYSEIKNIDEAFITASNKEIMPVTKIDGITVGNGKVGDNTKRLMELFREYTALQYE